jgi:hypothetical protein
MKSFFPAMDTYLRGTFFRHSGQGVFGHELSSSGASLSGVAAFIITG